MPRGGEMNTCSIQISKRCNIYIYKRGICSRCWKELVSSGLIQKGVDYPRWLKDVIRIQDAFDHYGERRSQEESLEEKIDKELDLTKL